MSIRAWPRGADLPLCLLTGVFAISAVLKIVLASMTEPPPYDAAVASVGVHVTVLIACAIGISALSWALAGLSGGVVIHPYALAQWADAVGRTLFRLTFIMRAGFSAWMPSAQSVTSATVRKPVSLPVHLAFGWTPSTHPHLT